MLGSNETSIDLIKMKETFTIEAEILEALLEGNNGKPSMKLVMKTEEHVYNGSVLGSLYLQAGDTIEYVCKRWDKGDRMYDIVYEKVDKDKIINGEFPFKPNEIRKKVDGKTVYTFRP